MENNNLSFDIIWQKESKYRLNLYAQNSIPKKELRASTPRTNSDILTFTCKNKKGATVHGGLMIRLNKNDKIDRLGIMIGPDLDPKHAFYSKITDPKEATFKGSAKALKRQIHEDSSNKATPIAEFIIDSVLSEISTRENAINNFLEGSFIDKK